MFSGDAGSSKDIASVLDNEVAQVAQDRVIVRNVDMSIGVTDVSDAINEISQIATLNGGWVVSSQHIEAHRGTIDIRVPAERLDGALASARQVAADVKSEVSTSQDFTEEFTDTNARITTMQDTIDSLRVLFNKADKIEDALAIQREITSIQSDLDALQARVNFLSQSSAYSLIKVEVLALPQTLEVDSGADQLAAAGGPVRFRAKFTPPEGIKDFNIEWDFGDGSAPQTTTRVAPFDVDGKLISAPIVHSYGDDTDSSYIVHVTVNGTGDSGAAEGEDVMVVTVTRVQPIDVYAGESQATEAGKSVKLHGTFTRPDGVSDLVYTWDFGDGTTPARVEAGADETVAEVEHTYVNYRPQGYDAVLTVNGQTAAGSTEGEGTTHVTVTEPEKLNSGTFTPGDTGRNAFRILSAIGKGLGTAAIFIGVLSPIWLALAVVAFVFYRVNRRNTQRRLEAVRNARQRAATTDSDPTQ